MAFITRDFKCLNAECEHVWEDFVRRVDENSQKCPVCDHAARWIIAAPNIGVYSMMSKDDQAKSLRKRSREHTKKQLKKDPTSMKMSRHVMGKK